MRTCRVCAEQIAQSSYEAPAPALTSIMTLLDTSTQVFVCRSCGHAQCDDIPDIQAFYDTGYRISLNSNDHDQIFAVEPDGKIVYRTDRQVELAERLLDLPAGALLLDYGAAKATTLRKLHARRPDIRPHVFDVSADYAGAWKGWISEDAQACYAVPSSWSGRFDAVMSHFVIEHVADPVDFIRNIRALLKPGGKLLLSLPDVSANPGDMTVADHLNHFSEASLRRALAIGGFSVKTIDSSSFPGAFFAVAIHDAEQTQVEAALVEAAVLRAEEICEFWKISAANLEREAAAFRGRKAAIYGAGFYGSWIYSRAGKELELAGFLDRNPHIAGGSHFGVPVLPPEQLADDVEVLFVGLNPLRAREAIDAQPFLRRPNLKHIWL